MSPPDFQQLQPAIDEARNLLADIAVDCRTYVSSKDVPLEERWNFFIRNELGGDDLFFTRLFCAPSLSLYDHLHWERYQTMTSEDLVSLISGYIEHNPTASSKAPFLFDLSFLASVKEELMQRYLRTMKYDW